MPSSPDPLSNPFSGPDGLQFRTAETADTRRRCGFCKSVLIDHYYQLAGVDACASCGEARLASQSLPDSKGKFLRALLYGGGAALAGLIVWSTVQIVTHIQIGLLAIGVGWMVGAAIRKATEGHGSRKYQFLAVALTYLAISMSFLPLLVAQAAEKRTDAKVGKTGKATAKDIPAKESAKPQAPPSMNPVVSIALLFGICLISPFLQAFFGFPSGLISLFILYLALQRAWTLTQPDEAVILGPYRLTPAGAA